MVRRGRVYGLLRKCLQFRLRTLLIFMTFACLLAARVNYLASQRHAVRDRILETGGHVIYASDVNPPKEPPNALVRAWYRFWVPPVARIELGVIRTRHVLTAKAKSFGHAKREPSSASASLLHDLRFFPEVVMVCSRSVDVDGRAARTLARLPHLEELWLDECNLDDHHLALVLKESNLQALSVFGSDQVTDESIEQIAAAPSIVALSISGTGITREGVERIATLMPGCNVQGSPKAPLTPSKIEGLDFYFYEI